MAICDNCKHNLVFQWDGTSVCRHVERGNLRAYDWCCIYEGEKECPYYQHRKKGDQTHVDNNQVCVYGGMHI